MFEKNYELRYGDLKSFNTVKPSAILDIFQDMATKHSDSVGYGIKKLYDQNLAWLLKGWRVTFIKELDVYKPLQVKTGVKNVKAVMSDRVFKVMQDEEEKIIATSSWFTFDTNNLRPCKVPSYFTEVYDVGNVEGEYKDYVNPLPCENPEKYGEITVSKRDLDTNNHLNNQKSAEILIDALPDDFSIYEMTILYKKSAHLCDVLLIETEEIDSEYKVQLKNQDGDICVIGFFTGK